jgi:small-conductance mechanosensitive channel
VARLERPFFLLVFFFGLNLAMRVLGFGLGFPLSLIQNSHHLLVTLLVLVWLQAGFQIFRLVLESLGRHHETVPIVEERTIPLFDIIGKLLLLGGASYTVLMVWGIDPTAWLASAGVLGIAVGFAAKDTLANLFGGFFIVADAPYKLGDFIILDSGERGRVTHVGIRSTRLLTRYDIEITIPNLLMANAKIINESGGPWKKERVRIKIGAAYGSDADQVCDVLLAVAREHEHICTQPEPRVRLRGFGDSSLDFELLCWIDEPVLRGRHSHELNMAVYKAFARAQIEIPYPKRDVYLHTQSEES